MQRRPNYFKYVNSRDLRSKGFGSINLRLRSVTLNISLKTHNFEGGSYLLRCILALESIAQQKAFLRRARKSLSSVQLQKGTVTGAAVCLRGIKASRFLERFTSIMLPASNNFDINSQISFDKHGNATFQFPSFLHFSEIEGEYVHFQPGKNIQERGYIPVNVSVATSCRNKKEGELLLSNWHIPINLSE